MKNQLGPSIGMAGLLVTLVAPPLLGQDSPLIDVQLHAGKGNGYVSSITYGVDLALNITDWAAI